jgi:hypothetical protein
MKKLFVVLLILLVVLVGVVGCGKSNVEEAEGTKADEGKEASIKIGLITGTVSQGEEEYRAAEAMIAKYGSDVILHATYPDNFMNEQETTISQIVSMASDPAVKAIVICQGVPGTAAAIDKVRALRDDIFFIVGVPHEDPLLISEKADLVLETDNLARGKTIIELADKMGATHFLHYSFPRHMSYELLAKRRDIFKAECEKRGIEFVFVNAPDPTGDAGIPGAQQFILEDVPRQVEKYGKNIALFSTNCAMQEPLIRSALNEGAIFPEQCCPSPYHAYPNALGIEIPEDKAGDVDFILEAIEEKITEGGGAGRFATWKTPANMAIIRASVEYAMGVAKGEINGFDAAKAEELLAKEAGNIQVKPFDKEKAPNFLMFVGESIIFGE